MFKSNRLNTFIILWWTKKIYYLTIYLFSETVMIIYWLVNFVKMENRNMASDHQNKNPDCEDTFEAKNKHTNVRRSSSERFYTAKCTDEIGERRALSAVVLKKWLRKDGSPFVSVKTLLRKHFRELSLMALWFHFIVHPTCLRFQQRLRLVLVNWN